VRSGLYPLDEIRERCDLVEVISRYVALRKTGRTYKGLCPFHNEKTPSFHVNPERQIWKCFGCGESGDVFSFVQKASGLTFPEAVEQLAESVGVKIERSEKVARELSERERVLRANNIACGFFRRCLGNCGKAADYLKRRGLTEGIVEKWRLGYAPDSWDSLTNHLTVNKISMADAVKAGLVRARENSNGFYDYFRDRLIFPIFDQSDKVIAFGGRALDDSEIKYLNSPETPAFVKNRTLYGLNFARKAITDADRLLVVEGYMDAIAAQEAGFANTVATMGTALTEEHVNLIARYTRNVVLSFDADSAGLAAALRSAPLFERSGFAVRILSMPGGEDPDSILRGGDASRFSTMIDRALPIPDFKVKVALASHNVATDEGKAAALKDISRILAEIESVMERERLIRLLAKFHPNFSTGTILAEDHLRAEVARYRARRTTGRQGTETVNARSTTAPSRSRPGMVERIEKTLLGIIIAHKAEPGKVFEVLAAKDFVGDDTRSLAHLLSRHYAQMGRIDEEGLRQEAGNTPAEALLTDLLVGVDESEIDHSVDELLEVLINHKKNERRLRLRTLAQKIHEGSVARGDEEYEEYIALVKETSSPWRR